MRKNKIRILHVAQAAGGVDRYIRMLLKYLDKEKFENILVCSQDFHEEDYRGLVDSFEQVEMIRAIGGNDLKAIKEVRTLIKKYNPDIVYAHSSKAGAIARIADIGLKNHCVYNPHGWAFNMRCSAKKKAIYTMIEKIAAPFCDKIICISDAEKQSALDKKICKEDKLQVIFNGVDIEAYESGEHNHFEDMEWHIRLVLEGEDRLVRNLEARESETFSYAADVNPEYNNEMEDPRINVMDFVLNKEFLRKASELLKKHQWEMICRHYIEGMTHREIAAEMGVSHQYVTKGIKKGLHRIRCTYT